MNRQTQRYVNRMNNVVRAIKEAPKQSSPSTGFNMSTYGYFTEDKCGSPACALGHYAFRRDLQKTFLLDKSANVLLRNGLGLGSWDDSIAPHFGITVAEAIKLFDVDGCDNAETNREHAIRYIASFIKQKWGMDIGVAA